MQNIEKNYPFHVFFGHLKIFELRMKKFLLQIKISKKAFEGDCLQKMREASAFITISANAKI